MTRRFQSDEIGDGENGDGESVGTESTQTVRGSDQAEGLCRTCGRRETCKRYDAEGGVWRCADYC